MSARDSDALVESLALATANDRADRLAAALGEAIGAQVAFEARAGHDWCHASTDTYMASKECGGCEDNWNRRQAAFADGVAVLAEHGDAT